MNVGYQNVKWTRAIVIQTLKEGKVIECYGCPYDLKYGDHCVLYEGKVLCLDCADGEGDLV